MSLAKKFEELDKGESQKETVDSPLGKRGYYSQSDDSAELGKSGLYERASGAAPASVREAVSRAKPYALPIVLILALVFVGFYLFQSGFFASLAGGAPGSFELTLTSGGKLVPGVEVSVYDGDQLLGSNMSDSAGVARFYNLPQKELRFSASSTAGRSEQLFDLRSQFGGSLALKVTGLLSFNVVDSTTKKGIAGAKAFYSIGNNVTKFVSTADAKGRVSIDLKGQGSVHLTVTANNYTSQRLTFLASKGLKEVLLSPNSGASFSDDVQPGENPFDQTSTVSVFLVSSDGRPVPAGTLVYATFASTGQSVEPSGRAVVGGKAVFELPVNSQVLFSVAADGFYAVTGDEATTALTVQPSPQEVTFTLQPISPLIPKTKFTVSTSTGEVIQTSRVLVIPTGTLNVVNDLSVGQTGSVQVDLGDNTTYYALVVADGFVPFVIPTFSAGDAVQAVLDRDVPGETSTHLVVGVVDEDGAPIAGASVSALLSTSELAALPVQTQFGQNVTFVLPFSSSVQVRAAFEPATSTTAIQVNGVEQYVETKLLTKPAFLEIRAVNLADNKLLTGVTFTSFYNNELYAECQENPCTLPVRGEADSIVRVSANGFAPYVYFSQATPLYSSKRVVVKLVPESAATATQVQLVGVYDENGNQLSGNVLRAGFNYAAHFYVTSPQAQQLSLYARVDSSSIKSTAINASSDVHLLEPLASDGVSVAKSVSFIGQSTGSGSSSCTDLENPVFEQPYRWVELTYDGTDSQEVVIPFSIPFSVRENSTFSLAFRATGVNGGVHARYPQDSSLGFEASTPNKADCYAQTTSELFTVIADRPPVAVLQYDKISSEFTNGDAVAFDPSQNKLVSQNSLKEYDLQVDSLLPGDAMPLELQQTSQCTVLLTMPNQSTTSKTSTSSCYRYDSSKKMLVFETHELNPTCPIYLEGDKFYLPAIAGTAGTSAPKRVREDKTALTFGASCSTSSRLQVPVKVNFIEDVSSLQVTPNANELGDGDAAKLLFTINNRQVGNRQIIFETENQNQVEFSSPAAHPIAWRGTGTLAVKEGTHVLTEYVFQNNAQQALKPGVGTVGYRQSTCASEFCCANGWCTQQALQDQVDYLRQAATALASKTAFRRGGTMPLSYFTQQPFKYVTVAQAMQENQRALSVQGVALNAPATCGANTPAIYSLSASIKGESEDPTIAAVPLELKQSDYLTPQNACGKTGGQDKSLTKPNGEVTLCNFIHGVNGCIESTNKSTVLSLDQIETLKFHLINCMYPVFPGAPVCPGSAMILPPINIGSLRTTADYDASDSPNAFSKLFSAVSDSNSSDFSIFNWRDSIRCIVPPSFQQFAITAATGVAEQAVDPKAAEAKATHPLTSNACARSDFFNVATLPLSDSLIPIAGVCCIPSVTATQCTPRRGKFFISVKDNTIEVLTQWGLTESCYPYWPFPTTLSGLLQKQNLVSVGFGMYQFASSNGANIEFSLTSEVPGAQDASKTANALGLTAKQCSADSDCQTLQQCSVSTIYQQTGGKCVKQTGTDKGFCSYGSSSKLKDCTDGTTCKQDTELAASCTTCGGSGEQCCVTNGQAFCKAGNGCNIAAGATCAPACGGEDQPICGGFKSTPACNNGLKPFTTNGITLCTSG